MARLIYKFKDKVLNIVPLSDSQGVTIGRHHTNAIIIDNLAVSGFHARIDMNENEILLTDLESKNGTFVNGTRIREAKLTHEDAISVGKHTLVLDLHDEIEVGEDEVMGAAPVNEPSAMSDASTMHLDTIDERQVDRSAESSPPNMVFADSDNLTILSGGQGEISLSGKTVTIGANKDADIVVSGFWGLLVGGPAVTITRQAADYVMRYSGGVLKPKRNGASVKGTIKLNHEDVVEVGPVRVQVMLSKRSSG